MDPITVAVACTALVVKGALESAGQEAGRSSWGGGARLVERVRARFSGDAVAETALDEARQNPDDEGARELLRRMLQAHMLRDPSFEDDVRRMVEEAVAAQGAGRASVNAAVIKNAQVFNEKVEVHGDWKTS